VISVECIDLRRFSDDPYGKVDDYPFGGGAGMVLRPEPIFRAVDSLGGRLGEKRETVLLSAKGDLFDQDTAIRFSMLDSLVLICGRYKDVDDRVRQSLVTREISIGDYILSGGEVAALVLVDAVVRLVPGVMGDFESALDDSFLDYLLAPPVYTRPRRFRDMAVPEVLVTGDHEKIKQWRHEMACRLTKERRPDLWERYLRSQQGEEGD